MRRRPLGGGDRQWNGETDFASVFTNNTLRVLLKFPTLWHENSASGHRVRRRNKVNVLVGPLFFSSKYESTRADCTKNHIYAVSSIRPMFAWTTREYVDKGRLLSTVLSKSMCNTSILGKHPNGFHKSNVTTFPPNPGSRRSIWQDNSSKLDFYDFLS